MNQDILKGSWLQIKGDVKSFFGKLTDDDMLQIEGKVSQIKDATNDAKNAITGKIDYITSKLK